jgi:steroid 5-alpha reductase family enzyme
MKERWVWLVRYVVVIILALVLAAALGEMELFKTTKFGKTGLNAARLVQFLGFGGALAVLWLIARRAAVLLPSDDERWNVLKSILVPLATLIVVASGQAVLLLVLGPVMSKAWQQAYNWVAIAAIIAAAVWLVAALFTGSASLTPLFGAGRHSLPRERPE